MGNQVRKRGLILNNQGLSKLNQAKELAEVDLNLKKYTLEQLSEKTGLTPNTLSKIFTGSAGVDRQSLICCFAAFNLTLLKEDYCYLKSKQDNFNLESVGDAHHSIDKSTEIKKNIQVYFFFYKCL